MTKRMRKSVVLALVGIFALTIGGILSWPVGGSEQTHVAAVRDGIVKLDPEVHGWLTYVPERVHVVADVLITVAHPSEGRSGWSTAGRFEFIRDGEKFRASSKATNPLTPLAGDTTVSWDGITFQFWEHGSQTLHLTEGLPEVLPLAFPNPLLLPASVSTGDVVRSPVQWLPAGFSREGDVILELLESSHASREVSSASADRRVGSRSEVRLFAPASDPGLISRIEIRDSISEGSKADLILMDYRKAALPPGFAEENPTEAWRFPRILDLTVHPAAEKTGGATWRARFVISHLEVGRQASPERFDLLREPVEHILDERGRKIR